MNILITGAKGFVGENLAAALKSIRDGKDRTLPDLKIEEIYIYDIDSSKEELETACENADFVFNLAGVNIPKDNSEFMQGNFGFASVLLDTLKKYNNKCPVMLSSSIQATLIGRYDSNWHRIERQRNVIQAVVTKTKDLSITELNSLLNNVLPLVQTNLTMWEITELLLSAPKYRGVTIQQMTVPIKGSYGGMRGLGGRSFFSVDFDTNAKAIREFIYGVSAD